MPVRERDFTNDWTDEIFRSLIVHLCDLGHRFQAVRSVPPFLFCIFSQPKPEAWNVINVLKDMQ